MKNSNCLTEQSLTLYSCDDLTSEEMQSASDHLAHCPDCSRELASIRRTWAALPRTELTLTEGEKNRFAEQVVLAARKRHSSSRLQVWGAAATTVTAGLLAVMIFQTDNLPTHQSGPLPSQLADFDLVENLDLLEEMELLEHLDLLELLEGKG